MTVAEVAKALRVDEKTVRNWIRRGLLVGVRVGRQYRIQRSDYEAFVAGKEKPSDPMVRALAFAG